LVPGTYPKVPEVARKRRSEACSVVFAYNHADWYVKLVLGLAAKYR